MRLIALLFCPLAFGTGAFVLSGVLEPMARALGVSVGAVASLQSGLAIACALSGPLLAGLTRRLPPRALLLGVLGAMAALNAASALAEDFTVLFWLRVCVGGIGALSLPLATSLAATGVSPEARPKAIATVYAGIPLALIAGIPLGSLFGNMLGWQASFATAAVICALAFALVAAFVPAAAPLSAPGTTAAAPEWNWPLIGAHLAVTFAVSASLFSVAGLIGPVIRAMTGFGGAGIAGMQVLIGIASLLGVHIGAALLAARTPYALILPFVFLQGSLGVLLPFLPMETATAISIAAMAASILLGPSAQSATGAIVQSRLADLGGAGATVLYSLNGSMLYLGQGLGIVLGGLVLDHWGMSTLPFAGIAVTLPGLVLALGIAFSARRQPA